MSQSGTFFSCIFCTFCKICSYVLHMLPFRMREKSHIISVTKERFVRKGGANVRTVRERILSIRLEDSIKKNPEYAKMIGIGTAVAKVIPKRENNNERQQIERRKI